MGQECLDAWLLVNFAGYPFAPNSLMPDNGLANLAAALMADGHRVRIEDYSTLSVMRQFTTPSLTQELADTWDALQGEGQVEGDGGGGQPGPPRAEAIARLEQGERRRAGMQEKLLCRIADELVASVERLGIRAVGFKLWNGDGLLGSAFLAEQVRRRCPGVKVFGGGPHVDIFMEQLLEAHDVFDALAYGECEETIRLLAQSGGADASLASIPNLVFREEGRVRRTDGRIVQDLDSLPMPVYDPDVYPAMAGDEKIRIIVTGVST